MKFASDAPWSLQEAAGMPRATTQSELLAWRPGGGRFAAYHKASGRLFVLMHAGVHWTHKKGGTEIWVFDTSRRTSESRASSSDERESAHGHPG